MRDLVGHPIGNFVIVSQIGSGTFGVVYLARHRYLKERQAAIKFLHAQGPLHERERGAFLKEAHILEQLQHPSILAIDDFGFFEECPYLVTPYAAGGSLRDRLDRTPNHLLPQDEVLPILLQIGQALAFAHQHHVIHRDLKPANILFTAQGAALLADFSIAVQPEQFVTMQLDSGGTPGYMAPEQYERIVSPSCDQYALGAVAYELFTGHRPFVDLSGAALAYKQRMEDPPGLRFFNPNVPPHVEYAIGKALARNRASRYGTVLDFLAALHPLAQAGANDRTVTRMTLPMPQQFSQDPPPAAPGQLPTGVRSSAPEREVSAIPHTSEKSAKQWWAEAVALQEEGRSEEALATLYGALQRYPHRGDYHYGMGAIFVHLGCHAEAFAAFERARSQGYESPVMYYWWAVALYETGQHNEALTALEQVLRLDPQYAAETYIGRGMILEAMGRAEDAALAYVQSVRVEPRVDTYLRLGNLLARIGHEGEALVFYREGLHHQPGSIHLQQALGALYCSLGRFAEARAVCEHLLQLDASQAESYALLGQALRGLDDKINSLTAYEQATRLDPSNAARYVDKGSALFYLGYYEAAIQAFREALELHPALAVAHHNIGLAWEYLGNQREAKKAYKAAKKLGHE